MLHLEAKDHLFLHLSELQIALVGVHRRAIWIVQLAESQILEPATVLVSHPQAQYDHGWSVVESFLEVEGVDALVLGGRHRRLKLDKLCLLRFRLVSLQDVVADLALDLLRQGQILHSCIRII